MAIVENKAQIGAALRFSRGNPGAIFASVNHILSSEMSAKDLVCIEPFPEDLFRSREEVDIFEEEVWSIAREWYRHPVFEKALRYGPLETGEMVELYMGNAMVWAFRNLLWLERLIELHAPAEIVCFGKMSEHPGGFFPEEGESFVSKAAACLGRAPRTLASEAGQKKQKLSFGNEPAKTVLREAREILYKKFERREPTGSRILIASALQHVHSLMSALRPSSGLVYLDESFRLAKLPFLKENKAAYYSYPEIETLDEKAKNRLSLFGGDLAMLRRKLPDLSGLVRFRAYDVTSLLIGRLNFMLETAAPQAAHYFEAFQIFLKKMRVEAVVVDEDTVTFRKCLIAACREMRIPTFQVPHGVNFADFHYDLFPVSSDHVLTGAAGIREFYKKNGTPTEKIHITGIPRYDAVAEKVVEKKSETAEKTVLLAMTTSYEFNLRQSTEEVLKAVQDVLCALVGRKTKLIIKFHPLQKNIDQLQDFIHRHKVKSLSVEFRAGGDVLDLALASDVTVSFPSNLAIECAALGKPVILLDYFKNSRMHVPFFEHEGAWVKASTCEQICTLLDKALGAGFEPSLLKQAGDWFAREWVGPLDGYSGERAAQVVLAVMRSSQKDAVICVA